MNPQVYELIEDMDRKFRDLLPSQRVRQALVDLEYYGNFSCMDSEAIDLLRSRVIRAAVLAEFDFLPPAHPSFVTHPRYTQAEADCYADHPHSEGSVRFVKAFLGSPGFRWIDSYPWFVTWAPPHISS